MPLLELVNVPASEVRPGDRVMGQGRGVVTETRPHGDHVWLVLDSDVVLDLAPAAQVCVRRCPVAA